MHAIHIRNFMCGWFENPASFMRKYLEYFRENTSYSFVSIGFHKKFDTWLKSLICEIFLRFIDFLKHLK